jgi:hypothetical protein
MVATTAPSDQAGRGLTLTVEPLLIDQFLPTYDLAVVHSRVLRAHPSSASRRWWTSTCSSCGRSGC